ncbi:dTMP kinase [Amycolatopsis sp.]|uniref:dTMP kinase n=1 Tax=Amycolatopsis sp. TaxID=37632 RepID=UPI0039C89BD1
MHLRPFSEHPRGVFVSVDGPSGAGKSTIVQHLAHLLVADGQDVHITAEPSTGPVGTLCSELTDTVTGRALACLYAADRYHHLEVEIRPHLRAGRTALPSTSAPPNPSVTHRRGDHGHRRRADLPVRLRQRPQRCPPTRSTCLGRPARRTRG